MTCRLTPAQVRAYEEDGVLYPVRVLSAAEAAEARARFDHMVAADGGVPRAFRQPHFEHRWAYDLALHDAVLDAVECLLGPDVVVNSTLVFYKRPGDRSFVSWHQDRLYPGLQTPLTTAWIALAPSTVENGCLRVIAGSHKLGIVPHEEVPEGDNLLKSGQTIAEVDESRARDVVLQPGEMSLHHGDIIHGSNPSRSGPPRIGLIVRYVTPATPQPPHPVVPARGRRDLPGLEVLRRPPAAEG